MWTLTLKRKNSAKIGSPFRHLSQDRIFSVETLGQITIWQFISLLVNRSMVRSSRVLCSVNHHSGRDTWRNKDAACWIE